MANKERNITINITQGSFVYLFLILLLIGLIFLTWDKLISILIVILFSVVIASGVEPGARWFQKFKIPRVLAVLLVYLITIFIIGFIFYLIVPTLFSELTGLSGKLSSYTDEPFDIVFINELIPGLPESIINILQDITLSAEDYIKVIMSGFSNAVSKIFGGVFSLVLIIVLSFYLAVQEKGIENFIRIITPVNKERYIVDLWQRSRGKIGKWLQGQILLGLLVGILVFLGLTILGVPYALVFALLAALFELIPIFGPILSSIPPIIIALLQGPTLALMVVGLYFLIQQFENHLIYPLVVTKIVGVPPILTILALFIGGKLGGFFGMLLAIPIIVVLVEIAEDIEKKKKIV